MRSLTTAETVRVVMRALGQAARSPARVYLVGGASAVTEGWRSSTLDIDLRIEPDTEITRVISELKERLGVNIEFASPADFLPELPGWRERSPFLFSYGAVEVFHYDFYSQALAKLERGFTQDLSDVEAMLTNGLVTPTLLAELFAAIRDELYRFPAVEVNHLAEAVQRLAIP
jgi:hypothetical protein